MQKRLHLLLALMVLAVSSAMAQVTTSALSGHVIADGEDVIGAYIEAIHTPSGTSYKAVTNAKGMYTINGMRAGGPYEVTIKYIGFETKTIKNITLQLGETYNLKTSLNEDAKEMDEVLVQAKGSKFAYEKTGASTNISKDMMDAMPTVSRSITDFTRLSPYGGNGMTFMGSDGRTANFTVDGANFNNDFGLSSGLPGGGNPISIEAIDEMQVVISPMDVRQSGFIGGGVNAITKSGTNTFQGSAYIYHKNENMRGDAVEGEQITTARDKDRKTTYGFTLGGPIIKNKLFFFVNGELDQIPTQVISWRGSEDGVADAENGISRTKLSDLQRVSDYVKTTYGYNTGSYTNFPADESNKKLLAKLTWNINDKNRLDVRYNFTKNRGWNSPNGTSMDGGSRMSGYRVSQYSMSYANSMYAIDNKVNTVSLDLNTRINNNLSNQFLAAFAKKDDVRYTDSDEFPFIDITQDGNNYIALGYELFTWNNAVHTTDANVKDEITYNLGRHKIIGGLTYEYQMDDNMYMRNGSGYYRYNSVENFLAGGTPEIVCLTYGYDGEKEPAARVRYNKGGFYAQDEWQATDRFKLTYGIRLEGLFFNNKDLMTNDKIDALTYYDNQGNARSLKTGEWPSSNIIAQPRVGFQWDVLGDKSLKVRGGTGIFAGRIPMVFFTNMPTNSGMVQYQAQINAKNAASNGFSMEEFKGGLVTDANGKATVDALYNKLVSLGYPSTINPEDGKLPSTISATASNYKLPQEWKTCLAVDYSLPVGFPLTITAEGMFNKTIWATYMSDWSISSTGGFSRFNGVDNRLIYPSGYRTNTAAFVLESTHKGYGWSASVSVNAKPWNWLSLFASYTKQGKKELTSMPGSNAESAFYYVPCVNGPANMKLHNAYNLEPDRFVASITGHDKGNNHYSLIYETWRGGYNYSYMTTNDMNGDSYNYDAIYIPTDQQVESGAFRFVSQDDQERFMGYVHNNSYLKNHQGEYAEAYSLYNPWVHRVDISYKHDFKLKIGKQMNTLQLGFDLKNLMNLFNSSWGVSKYLNPEIGSEARILKYEGVDADGVATFSTPTAINADTKTFTPYHVIGQCWNMSIGIKYMFN